ncbi:adenine phosphoribosyltransferase [Ruminococcaceae bacterium OttesenSCG-928-O06]|nr:adenine phosphoribosyltransferase [Ruminococcaceae bacterium OttesenSCG-928-O06]
MGQTYELHVAGLVRHLPICKISEDMSIAAFIMFGDVELTIACAEALLAKVPAFDVIVTAEAKAIPLAYEMSRQSGKKYIPARKGKKLYMEDPVVIEVQSITTESRQSLCIDRPDLDYLNGKRVLIVDDVISTGGSLQAMEAIVAKSTATIVARAAVLAEGGAADRKDITFLAPLPLQGG